MKEIIEFSSAKLSLFQNSEHFSFMADVIELCKKFDPKKLKVEKEFAALVAAYGKEDGVYDPVRVSEYTEPIRLSDETRTSIYRGFETLTKANLRHPEKTVAEAAVRMKKLFDSHGDMRNSSYNARTAIILDILLDIAENYTADITLLAADVWVTKLDEANKNFTSLMEKRFEEESSRPQYKMKEVRATVDDAYQTLVTRQTALMIVEDPEKYYPFVEQLNSYIKYYNERVKQRSTRNKNKSRNIADAQLLPIDVQPYTGNRIIPSITLTYTDPKTKECVTLTDGTDYTLDCNNNIEPGSVTLTIKAKGKYTGKLVTMFYIVKSEG